MGLLDTIKEMFTGVSFGNVDPNDLEAYWLMGMEMNRAENESDEAIAALCARYGLRDRKHFEKVQEALAEKHGTNPEFMAAQQRAIAKNTQVLMGQAMKGPPGS